MSIGDTTAELSVQKNIQLCQNQCGCDEPIHRVKATLPTFGDCIVMSYLNRKKIRTLFVFG